MIVLLLDTLEKEQKDFSSEPASSSLAHPILSPVYASSSPPASPPYSLENLGVVLMIQWYAPSSQRRVKELQESLAANILNPLISLIVLFYSADIPELEVFLYLISKFPSQNKETPSQR